MKSLHLTIFLINLIFCTSYAHDLSLNYGKNIQRDERKVLESAMEEVSRLLPQNFKNKLPKDINIEVSQITGHSEIPENICGNEDFTYGRYRLIGNSLIINKAVLKELAMGKEKSKRIKCQHKSLYNQAIATIIHELSHAYDFNNGRISKSQEFIRISGFKKGFFRTKNKNVHAMRSPDTYELVNTSEYFAVNMEYFAMDPEFMCRKPSMFEFYRGLFGIDPFLSRKCSVSNMIMTSSQSGYTPTELLTNRVYRIDYLLASPGKGLSSGFGHTMFRIVVCAPERFDPISNSVIPATPFGEDCLKDKLYHLVVSYRANVDDGKLSYIKGLTGGYPSILFILNFSDVLDEYNRDELRDLISYPLKFSKKEIGEFITKVREEHWNYQGAYKFITNNCAVESYDLLKSALNTETLQTKSSLTPNGVLEDLVHLNFLSEKDRSIEIFKAKTDQIILAYNKAYGYQLKKRDKSNKDAVLKFIDKSTTAERMSKFNQFIKTETPRASLKSEVIFLKERLVAASSFSVMEQQIMRTQSLKSRKKIADMFMNTEDEKILAIVKETGENFNQKFTDLSKSGYGIPLKDEMVTSDEQVEKAEVVAEVREKAEKLIKDMVPDEFEKLEEMAKNILIYNKYSLALRKEFRSKLETYIDQALKKLLDSNLTRDLMLKAATGDSQSLAVARELMGKDLVTEKEILDSKLVKVINELILK